MRVYEIVIATMYFSFLSVGVFFFEPLWVIAAVLLDAVCYLRGIEKKIGKDGDNNAAD